MSQTRSNSSIRRRKLHSQLLNDELPRPWRYAPTNVPYPKYVNAPKTRKKHGVRRFKSRSKLRPKSRSKSRSKTSSPGYGHYIDLDSW